jgi:exopolysaccharide biosynthesis protein
MWKKIRNLHLFVKLFIFVDFVVLMCFLVVYGPVDYAKVFWITTAMETNDHQYLANIFYSEDTIKQVMNENYMDEIEEDTDASSITVGQEEKITSYSSAYEKEILEHEEGALYKLIQFKYNDFDCHMVAVYDPTRVEVGYNKKKNSGRTLSEILKSNKAILGINGGGYRWGSGYPQGLIVHDGKIVYSSSTGKYLTAAINEDGVLLVGKLSAKDVKKKNIKEAVSFGPALIVNGKAATFKGTGGSGLNPRTVIAQRKDGIILFLVVNGYGSRLSWKGRGGVYVTDLIKILQRYNAYNAVNMDGGSSTTMVINGKLINDPCEPLRDGQDIIRSAWMLK